MLAATGIFQFPYGFIGQFRLERLDIRKQFFNRSIQFLGARNLTPLLGPWVFLLFDKTFPKAEIFSS
jgi:hypothetical protein